LPWQIGKNAERAAQQGSEAREAEPGHLWFRPRFALGLTR
jgi:hypothetical protein